MAALLEIETEPGLIFDVLADGAADAPLVLLLHGFAESFHMWRAQLPALAAAGYRALAPSQRGYSRGARPDTADVANSILSTNFVVATIMAPVTDPTQDGHVISQTPQGGTTAKAGSLVTITVGQFSQTTTDTTSTTTTP